MSSDKSPKDSGGGRLRRAKDAPQPSATAFDLLDGAFVKVARARLVRLLSAGAAAVVIAFVALQSLWVRLDASEIDHRRRAADQRFLEVKEQVTRESNTGGLTRKQMEDHLQSLGRGAAVVAHNDLPLQELLAEIESRTPGNVTVTQLAAVPAVGDEGVAAYSISMTATTTGYDAAFAYRDALRASPHLSALELTWSGSEEQLSLAVTASVSARLETDRAMRYRTQFASDFDAASAVQKAAAQATENTAEHKGDGE